jgi:peptidoglycan hydrolase-like protein with peptidoglycan-binding domain
LLGTVVVAGAAGGFGRDDDPPSSAARASATGLVVASSTTPVVVTDPTTVVAPKTDLVVPLSKGNTGSEVERLQARLKELGFDPGPIDGQFGDLTRAAVWAFEKLVLQTPRSEATGRVTNDMWQRMQDPLVVMPRRPEAATANHTEIYLPEQVVIFFVEDRPALISHMSSGTGEQWCEEVTISPGEYGNEDGTEPLKRGECGISNTPGGVFEYYRRVEGVRQSGLGGMWNPVYFNYGIAIHGAINVPLEPASHGCIRIPMSLSEYFQDLAGDGDQVFVFDGIEEPEHYGAQLPTFNWRDPDYTTTTTAPAPTAAPTGPTTTASTPTGTAADVSVSAAAAASAGPASDEATAG